MRSVDNPRSGRNEDLVDQTCPTPRQRNITSRADQSRPQPAEERRRVARMPGKNPREVSDLLTSRRAFHQEACTASTRRDTAWWRWLNHGCGERRLLGTQAQTFGKVDTRRLLGLQAFQSHGFHGTPSGRLPENRTTGETAFEVVGTDFAGPIRYRRVGKREGKAYLVIFSCSLSRAVHLEILPNLETATFIPCLKRLVARRGRPKVIYSDNGRTFVKAAKWLEQAVKDERLHSHLEECNITWKFNLSTAPWWGGQFERLIGVVKKAMHKSIGGATLNWQELSEVMLDIEIQINRRPLCYMENDVEIPTLTPSTFLFQRPNQLPEQEPWREEEKPLRKRAKFLIACKKNLWNRWRREYLIALRERHNLTHQTAKFKVAVGDVVIVKSDDKNRGNWPLAVVQRVFPGKDGVIRVLKLKTAKGTLERPVQHLYPMELAREGIKPGVKTLNPDAKVFRPRRKAAVEANERIQKIAEFEQKQIKRQDKP